MNVWIVSNFSFGGANNFYFFTNTPKNHAMQLALDAILGHKSAHSFATGPVMAEPFISPLLFTVTPALSSE